MRKSVEEFIQSEGLGGKSALAAASNVTRQTINNRVEACWPVGWSIVDGKKRLMWETDTKVFYDKERSSK